MDSSHGGAPVEADGSQAFEEGNRLAAQGDVGGAERAYERADEAGHPTGAAYVGLFSEMRGDREQAEAAYRRADERGDGYGAFRLGLLLSHAGDWDGAAGAWGRAEQRGRHDPPFDPAELTQGGEPIGPALSTAGQRSAFASPVLLGAVTALVAIIGVFLAYNASTGLPFVPTRELKVDLPNGAALVDGNDVYSGGFRVGLVSDLQPIRLKSGQIGAQATLALNESFGAVPADSIASIRPRSLLGLKYVDIQRGTSTRVFPDGATLPLTQSTIPVQFDDINKTFDAKTRPAVQQDLVGFGDTLASRGSSLNDTFASLPALFQHLIPVARYLSAPSTELTRFFVALNGFFSTISPVAAQNEESFADQATTYAAIAHNDLDLEDTIKESPSTLDVSTASLKVQQPFLVDLTTFSNYLAPATAQLRAALPQLNPALEAGIRVLPRTPSVNSKLQSVLAALRSLALDPGSNIALNGLTSTVDTLNPMIKYLGPSITVCNEFNYTWAELGDLVSEQTSIGMAYRSLVMFANHQTNNVGSQGATAPANGYVTSNPADLAAMQQTGGADTEYYHSPVYANAIDNHGNADCEYGQRGYPLTLNALDPQHRLLDTDAGTPGNQGTTWAGLSKVPAGETFSREPTTGPQLPSSSVNP